MHPGESLLSRAVLGAVVLPMEDQECVEPLVYGLDFQVVPRSRISMPANVRSSIRRFPFPFSIPEAGRTQRCRPCCLSS